MSTAANVHPTAIVAAGAHIPASCSVGPYSTIGPHVVLGENCNLISHVVLDGHLTVGANTIIYPFACVGVAPQDLKYAGEPTRCTSWFSTTRSSLLWVVSGMSAISSRNTVPPCAYSKSPVRSCAAPALTI